MGKKGKEDFVSHEVEMNIQIKQYSVLYEKQHYMQSLSQLKNEGKLLNRDKSKFIIFLGRISIA